MRAPSVSVIVPTVGRRASLLRLMRALAVQDAAGPFEVVIVFDGPARDVARDLGAAQWPFPVQFVEQPPSGPAAARNRGAALAHGDVLLFLDDDIEPGRGVLSAHVSLHAARRRAIGLGALSPAIAQDGFFGITLREWSEGMTEGWREPGHRYVHRDLLSGHFSMSARTFKELGGFDPTLRCHEDYELGYRAIGAGCDLQFLPEAVARHHDASNLAKVLRRKFDEGVADVQLASMHRPLAASLPLARPAPTARLPRLLNAIAWRSPAAGEVMARALAAWLLPVYEQARLRFRWRHLLDSLLGFWYWRGVSTATAGQRERLDALCRVCIEPSPGPEIPLVIDVAQGFDAAEQRLDLHRPRAVRLMHGASLIGDVPEVPGAERLRGAHLRRLIARQFALEYLRAAAFEGAVPDLLSRRALELTSVAPREAAAQRTNAPRATIAA